MAIIEYLDETYPQPPLIPKDIGGRAYVRAVSQIIGCDIHPLNNVRVLKHLAAQFGADEAATKAWYRHWIEEGWRAPEAYLGDAPGNRANLPRRQRHHGGHLPGSPDLQHSASGCALDGYPSLNAIFERCMMLDAFRSTQPNTQADAF